MYCRLQVRSRVTPDLRTVGGVLWLWQIMPMHEELELQIQQHCMRKFCANDDSETRIYSDKIIVSGYIGCERTNFDG